MSHRYSAIIDLPHKQSDRRPPMPMADRAAQFAPFAALTGHDDAIRQTARRTQEEYLRRDTSFAGADDLWDDPDRTEPEP